MGLLVVFCKLIAFCIVDRGQAMAVGEIDTPSDDLVQQYLTV